MRAARCCNLGGDPLLDFCLDPRARLAELDRRRERAGLDSRVDDAAAEPTALHTSGSLIRRCWLLMARHLRSEIA